MEILVVHIYKTNQPLNIINAVHLFRFIWIKKLIRFTRF